MLKLMDDNECIHEFRELIIGDTKIVMCFYNGREIEFNFVQCSQEEADIFISASAYRKACLINAINSLIDLYKGDSQPLTIKTIAHHIQYSYDGLCKNPHQAAQIVACPVIKPDHDQHYQNGQGDGGTPSFDKHCVGLQGYK